MGASSRAFTPVPSTSHCHQEPSNDRVTPLNGGVTTPRCNSKALDRWLHAESDAAALDLIGAVLQDVPQIILQLYLLAYALPSLAASINQYTTFFGAMALDANVFSSTIFKRWFSDLKIKNDSEIVGYAYLQGNFDINNLDNLLNNNAYFLSDILTENNTFDNYLTSLNLYSTINNSGLTNNYGGGIPKASSSSNESVLSPLYNYLTSGNSSHVVSRTPGLKVPEKLLPDTAKHQSKYAFIFGGRRFYIITN